MICSVDMKPQVTIFFQISNIKLYEIMDHKVYNLQDKQIRLVSYHSVLTY